MSCLFNGLRESWQLFTSRQKCNLLTWKKCNTLNVFECSQKILQKKYLLSNLIYLPYLDIFNWWSGSVTLQLPGGVFAPIPRSSQKVLDQPSNRPKQQRRNIIATHLYATRINYYYNGCYILLRYWGDDLNGGSLWQPHHLELCKAFISLGLEWNNGVKSVTSPKMEAC